MDLIWHVHKSVIPSALALLPGQMDSMQARAMLLATGLQESGFNARMQGGSGTVRGDGPAAGLWQFERTGGVTEILGAFPDIVHPICRMLLYSPTPATVHKALADNDVLACVFARLLLWRDPRSMPESNNPTKGWRIYLERWRPGMPHADSWTTNFRQAWEIVRE